ncbi:MAG: hypothetical protein AAFQ68_27530, partial [Bacteroidota bacterium]
MKYIIFSLSFIAAALSFTACDPLSMTPSIEVKYSLEFSKTDILDQLEVELTGVRARQTTLDGEEVIRSVNI